MAIGWAITANPASQHPVAAITTFSGLSITTPCIVILLAGYEIPSHTVMTSVTLDSGSGPVAMNKAIEHQNSSETDDVAAIWYLAVASGTAATVVLTSAYTGYCSIALGCLTGSASAPASTNSGEDWYSASSVHPAGGDTVPSGGIDILITMGQEGNTITGSWANATPDFTTAAGGYIGLQGAHATSSGTPTWTGSNSGYTLASAQWAAAGGGGGSGIDNPYGNAMIPTLLQHHRDFSGWRQPFFDNRRRVLKTKNRSLFVRSAPKIIKSFSGRQNLRVTA